MSHTLQEKIELLRQEIMEKASAERNAILKEAEENKKQELDREQSRQLEEIYRVMHAQTDEIKLENVRKLSMKTRELRKQLYHQREQYLSELIARARAELVAFTAKPDYIDYLVDTARQLAQEYPDAAIELRAEDLSHAPALRAVFSGEISTSASPIAIGGLRLVDAVQGICIDCTLGSALENQRKWFYENSHLHVEEGGN